MEKLSKTQRRILQTIKDGKGSTYLSVGAIRSGKTFATTMAFLLYTKGFQPEKVHLISGKNRNVLDIEIVNNIALFAEKLNMSVDHKRNLGELWVDETRYIVVAGYDTKAVGRIQGLTIGSALVDEATLVPEEFFETILGRLTFDDSKMWATCNPSSNSHWLKKNWVDEEKFDKVLNFGFDDNPTLGDKVKERNNKLFSGIFYERMVLGKWSDAEGQVYQKVPMKSMSYNEADVLNRDVGIDYGTAGTTAFVEVVELKSGQVFVNNVWYYNARDTGVQKSDEEIIAEFFKWIGDKKVHIVWFDPRANSLIVQFRKYPGRRFIIRQADASVLNGIRVTMNMFAKEKLVINSDANNKPLLDEIADYIWDPQSEDDRPIKEFDHAVDAMRYAVYSRYKKMYGNLTHLPSGL